MPEIRVDEGGGRRLDQTGSGVQLCSQRTRDPSDVIFARQALDRQHLEIAEEHLRRALDANPDSAQAWTLMGVLHERLREYHAAYHCYKQALTIARNDRTALAGLRRYCERFGFDLRNRAINPGLD